MKLRNGKYLRKIKSTLDISDESQSDYTHFIAHLVNTLKYPSTSCTVD